jgi:CubicO group peptidase (beta-lactamase class C family)
MRILLFLFFLLWSAGGFAQSITGKITDRDTQLPISSAHLSIPETGEATLTDAEGIFSLVLYPSTVVRHLRVSCIGYQSFMLLLRSGGGMFNLALSTDTVQLAAVEVTPIDPIGLLRKAMARAKENHGGPRTLHCFYRLEAKKADRYIHLSEAAFELYQNPDEESQVKIIKAREVEDERAFNGVGMQIGTKVGTVKNLDFALSPTVLFLSAAGLRKHDFVYEGISTIKDEEVYTISFDQKENLKEGLYRGRVFLSTSSYAFIRIEYALSPQGMPYVKAGSAAERAALKLLNIQLSVSRQQTVIDYRLYQKRWYLDHISRDETARVKSKRYNFDVTVDERSDFLITRIDTTQKNIHEDAHAIAGRFLESNRDTAQEFWKDYNILPSATNYALVAAEIQARNGHTLLKKNIEASLRKSGKGAAAQVDSILQKYHQQGFFNGTALVQHQGHVLLHKGYGYADRTTRRMNDTTTVFRIGSLSKSFTSRIIYTLQQEGLLDYQDTIQKFLPWYPNPGITLDHLLTHASGIPNYTALPQFLDSLQHAYTLEEIVRLFGCEKPLFDPGKDFNYSNTGYTLLALIAEKASGKTFRELLQEKIISPLALSHTRLGIGDSSMAKGYLYGVEEPLYALANVTGAGGISATASDLLRWSNNQNMRGLETLFVPRTYYTDWGVYYGYGWMIDKYQFRVSKHHIVLLHPGTDFGFSTMLARQPDRGNVVILLNNTGEFPLFDITDLILSVLN